MKSFLKRMWEGWKRIAHVIGDFQARVILTIFYAVLVLPFGLAVRIFADPRPGPDIRLDSARFSQLVPKAEHR